jgi:hypothetical protein
LIAYLQAELPNALPHRRQEAINVAASPPAGAPAMRDRDTSSPSR